MVPRRGDGSSYIKLPRRSFFATLATQLWDFDDFSPPPTHRLGYIRWCLEEGRAQVTSNYHDVFGTLTTFHSRQPSAWGTYDGAPMRGRLKLPQVTTTSCFIPCELWFPTQIYERYSMFMPWSLSLSLSLSLYAIPKTFTGEKRSHVNALRILTDALGEAPTCECTIFLSCRSVRLFLINQQQAFYTRPYIKAEVLR